MVRRLLSVCLLILLLMGVAANTVIALENMQVFYFDVGQAESTLLLGPDFSILIDAGDRGRHDVSRYLEKLGVETIDLFVLTHPHADHIGQAAMVIETFEVREVWLSGYEHSTMLYEELLDAILASDADYWEPRTGQEFFFGDLKVQVLNPTEIGNDLHDTNIVIRALYGDVSFLFTGDAERKTEDKMVQNQLLLGFELQSQILQLGHHGSRTSSSLDFLLAVKPEVAVYSAGLNNQFDHPHEEVLNRLKMLEISVYGTDCNGTLIVQTDGASYSVFRETGENLLVSHNKHTSFSDYDGRVELNTAPLEDLERVVHIGPARAREIMELREARPFRSLDDLKRVSGLGEKRIEEIKQEGLAYVKGVMEN